MNKSIRNRLFSLLMLSVVVLLLGGCDTSECACPDQRIPDKGQPDKGPGDGLAPDMGAPDLKGTKDQKVPDLAPPDQATKDASKADALATTCKDGKKNGDETDVDCGGSYCPGCQTGQACKVAGDCASNDCFMKVCIDPKGLLCSFGGLKLTSNGGFSTIRTHGQGSLMHGIGKLVADSNGVLYGSDPYGSGNSGDRVLKIAATGTVTDFAVPTGMSICVVSQPTMDAAGNVYLYDLATDYVLKIDPTGKISNHTSFKPLAGGSGCSNSSIIGLLANADGSLFAGSPIAGKVYQVSKDGATQTVLASVKEPFDMAHDGSGGVLVVSQGIIYQVSKAGAVSTIFDPTAGPGKAFVVGRDTTGDIYFNSSNNVYKLDSKASTLTVVATCMAAMNGFALGKPTSSTSTGNSIYVTLYGITPLAYDGDRIIELQR